ncbi:MAG: hypothetical protein GX145_03945 [Clostridiaceae bacterium]|jgi:hypothetical protein|nr:hypothetical protein [Bacillota bacterium]NLN51950.1 hypothetical protein [Clostridiaceae bacterium]
MFDDQLLYTWATCELAGYRKGYITVKLDFKTNVLSWKDSNYWFNNFVRGLPKSQMKPLYDVISRFVEEYRDKSYETMETPQLYVWNVQVSDDNNNTLELSGYDTDSEIWQELVEAIEKAGHRDFKL